MCDEDNGFALLFMQRVEQIHHEPPGLAVQRAGGFVRQNDGRVVGHGSGNGDALLLSAGKLVGHVIHAVAHLYHFQQFLGACSALGQRDVGVEHGQFDVFERGIRLKVWNTKPILRLRMTESWSSLA